jgi:hypothetical protein
MKTPNNSAQLADMLREVGYELMASHAEHETNQAILRGYVFILMREARKTKNINIARRLYVDWSKFIGV